MKNYGNSILDKLHYIAMSKVGLCTAVRDCGKDLLLLRLSSRIVPV